MGGWRMEVFKMALYIAFPVGMFHWFNQPENFESWVIQTKKEYFPPEDKKVRVMYEDFIRKYNAKQDEDELKAMEEAQKKFDVRNASQKSFRDESLL